jgi:chromosome segregation ATPase
MTTNDTTPQPPDSECPMCRNNWSVTERLAAELDEAREKVRALDGALNRARTEAATANGDAQRAAAYQREVEALRVERDATKSDNATLFAAFSNESKALTAARETIAALESTVADLNARLGEAERHNKAWHEKAATWMASPEAAARLDGYRDLTAQLEDARASLMTVRQQADDALALHNEAEAERDAARAELAQARAQLAEYAVVERERDQLLEDNGFIARERDASRANAVDRSKLLDEVRSDLDTTRAELSEATARADEADARLTEAMSRLAAMREALQAMRAEARTAPHFALAAMHAADAALSDEPGAAAAFLERVRAEAHRAGVEQAAVECEFHASQWTGATTKILLVQAARIRALASPAPLPATPSEETPT